MIRQIRCEEGEVPVVVNVDPRPNYGLKTPSINNAGKLGWRINIGTSLLSLRSDFELALNPHGGLSAEATLKVGSEIAFSLTFSEEGPAVLPPLGSLVSEKLGLTKGWWEQWMMRGKYDGPYRRHVMRSALVLALLSYAPSGALVAAPTSLPERIGGDLNWDYRFCWLRDAALAVRALFALGYDEDAEAFVRWLLHTTRLTRPGSEGMIWPEIVVRDSSDAHGSTQSSSHVMKSETAVITETALITGANSAIGIHLAKEFASHKHPLVLVASAAAELDGTAPELKTTGAPSVRTIATDLEESDAPQAIFDELARDFICVDILVNNAGSAQKGKFWEINIEDDVSLLHLNIEAVLRLTKLFLPAMIEHRRGRILNVASVAGFEPGPLMGVYHASKAFVLSFTEALATELINTGVTATALCPGPTDSDFYEKSGMLGGRLLLKTN